VPAASVGRRDTLVEVTRDLLLTVNDEGKNGENTVPFDSTARRDTVTLAEGRLATDRDMALTMLFPCVAELAARDTVIALQHCVLCPRIADDSTRPIDSLSPPLETVTQYTSYFV